MLIWLFLCSAPAAGIEVGVASAPTFVPTAAPTYNPRLVYFPVRQQMVNITAAQFSSGGAGGPVGQIFTAAVQSTLICCEVYTISIAGVSDRTAGTTAAVQSPAVEHAQAQTQTQAPEIQLIDTPASRKRSLRDRDRSLVAPTGMLLGASPASRLEVNYTVAFLYTEFNFTSASHAYTVISGALALGINAGGFERNFILARNAATCYGNGAGTCGLLKNTHAGQGEVGDTLIPFPSPTMEPTAGPADDSNGIPLAVGMAVTMVFFISVFCYFQYFYKPGMRPWWLGGDGSKAGKLASVDKQDVEEDFEMTSQVQSEEEIALGQLRSKSTRDLGDPDLRFGFGHAEYRRQSMRAIPLKPDYTAAPPEIANSPAQRERRYSTKPVSKGESMPTLFGASASGGRRDEATEDSYIASLFGTATMDILASISKEEVRSWVDAAQEQEEDQERENSVRRIADTQKPKNDRASSRSGSSSTDSSDTSDSDSEKRQQTANTETQNKSRSRGASAGLAAYASQRVPFSTEAGNPAPANRGVAASITVHNPLQSSTPVRGKAPARGPPTEFTNSPPLPLQPPTPPVKRFSLASRGGVDASGTVRPAASPEAPVSSGRSAASVISVRNPLAPVQSPTSRAPAPAPAPAAPLPMPPTPPQRRAFSTQQSPAIGFPPAPLYASSPSAPAPLSQPKPQAPSIPAGMRGKLPGRRSSLSASSPEGP